MPIYSITPQDVLFFRDGRPMASDVGSGGHGARWPEPSILFDAFHGALHRAFPGMQPEGKQAWEKLHFTGRNGRYLPRGEEAQPGQRFGSLLTAGPFPCVHKDQKLRWLIPNPADVILSEAGALAMVHPIKNAGGRSNLPNPPLEYALASSVRSGKPNPKPWWSKKAIEEYLKHEISVPEDFWKSELWDTKHLFGGEWSTGIGIDKLTETQDGEHIYSAEYLRLHESSNHKNPGVSLGVHAQLQTRIGNQDAAAERLGNLFPKVDRIVCGGQQRCCHVEEVKERTLDQFLPMSVEITGDRVKWVLLSPAIFPVIERKEVPGPDGIGHWISAHPGGWLPNWIAPTGDYRVYQGQKAVVVEKGRVLLKPYVPRDHNPNRWNRRIAVREADFLDCRLVAACIPKPIVLSGWSDRHHLRQEESATEGPKPTLLAVPAGAVYYFQGKDAPQLANVLSWHGTRRKDVASIENRRSTLLGEKGYGLGVCAPWRFQMNS